MQSALDCAGKCDCCQNLQSQINTLKQQIAGIKPVDELSLKNSIKSSLQPELTTFVAGAVVVATNKLQPQIAEAKKAASDAFLQIVENTRQQRLLEIEQRGLRESATRVERNAAEYARQMK
ncbi:MAG: hypothetical protein RM049_30785 [Nostoc sp. DedQUE04]|uniref:hypothetical protein n=1 Tax=Nostoc sp. DedQUE04 TaxID=3075390 RepID=UPI002AD246C6|nr:hypothetical protein [Nostoc sp. DedQUE04]MDZ8139627.1 hypothetical protein [Nostoc sp. DedQUE04]